MPGHDKCSERVGEVLRVLLSSTRVVPEPVQASGLLSAGVIRLRIM